MKSTTQENNKKLSKDAENRQEGSQSLYRAISLIRAVARSGDTGIRMSEIAQEVDLPTSTVHRILSVFVSERFLEFNQCEKKYSLGYELFALGAKAHRYQLLDQYREAIKRVSEVTEETTYLVTRSGNDALCVDRVLGSYPIQVLTFEVNELRPLGIGSGSLAILSLLPDEMIETITTENEEKFKNFKGMNKFEIKKIVKKVRQDGFAISMKVVNSDTVGVGVAIQDKNGKVVGAISVAGIASRMKVERRTEIVDIIRSEIKRVCNQG
ncbi:IclR family transcriptional regulator [uncultured Desulfuromusa sp.]|uniref:IclR family transcriptional regulator n=1 Tax=uncultured Desulfuromusa sp. TaxID=219183 RepID=UPI002AA8AE02|nr:IclR family transcriptional regulator [uncultured Desulfuromusa sp.]